MIVLNKDSILDKSISSYVALGSFDGIHKGHLTLINKVVDLAKRDGNSSVIYTFENHPRSVLNKNNSPKMLTDNKSKLMLFHDYGLDIVYFEKFDKDFMKLSPEEFIKYICDKFKIKGIVVGFNYRFGYKNMGDVELLNNLAEKYNFKLYVLPPYKCGETVVSSTKIREAISNGKVEKAKKMLNRAYSLKGKVVYGKQLGRTMGFPTANLEFEKNILLPKEGVYYTVVMVNNNIYKGITSIGNNPTFSADKITVETYILDFESDIYGINIEVFFEKRIRGMIKFSSMKELKEQLEKDKNFARKENSIYNHI